MAVRRDGPASAQMQHRRFQLEPGHTRSGPVPDVSTSWLSPRAPIHLSITQCFHLQREISIRYRLSVCTSDHRHSYLLIYPPDNPVLRVSLVPAIHPPGPTSNTTRTVGGPRQRLLTHVVNTYQCSGGPMSCHRNNTLSHSHAFNSSLSLVLLLLLL